MGAPIEAPIEAPIGAPIEAPAGFITPGTESVGAADMVELEFIYIYI
jgi:hypothetical protein